MHSRAIVERRVPGSERTRNIRVPSTENATPIESNKKVPPTPRRQPATNPAAKLPITSPLERKHTPMQLPRQSTCKQSIQKLVIGRQGKYVLSIMFTGT